jgi:hypothetical protein
MPVSGSIRHKEYLLASLVQLIATFDVDHMPDDGLCRNERGDFKT